MEPTSMTAKTVRPGEASSKHRARQAAAKVEDNAARVEAINAGREAVEAAFLSVLSGGDVEPAEQACDAAVASVQATELPTDRLELLAMAKAETKAVKAAEAAGEPKPATPATDALGNPEFRKALTGAARTTKTMHPLYVQAMAAKKAGKRGRGRKVTDDELAAYITGAREARPESTMNQELEIAYWVEKLSLSRSRWVAAWEGRTSHASPPADIPATDGTKVTTTQPEKVRAARRTRQAPPAVAEVA